MSLVPYNKAMLCKSFPSIVVDKALTCFTSLRANNISSLSDLEKTFMDKFYIAVIIPKMQGDLTNVKQRDGKTLLA